uniref:tRNA (uracil-O(2)-)-methyltransferase n=1 Tax=Syphacia muris TaxID=451379 RepID=A0A0N5AMT1_9BILA
MGEIVLVSGKVELPTNAFEQYFQKLLDIWCDRCDIFNKRLAGTCLIDKDTEEFDGVCKKANVMATGEVQIRKMVPKSEFFSTLAYEASFPNGSLCRRFYPCVLDGARHPHVAFPYTVSLQVVSSIMPDTTICELCIHANVCEESSWLCSTAFPSLLRVLKNMDLTKPSIKTHSLVDSDSFIKTYRRIKAEYGRQIVNDWSERTDPLKYVYEDCCIAAYLSEVYKNRRKELKFCDVGCGNGLLVYLLNKLDFNGFGFDLRERRIWSKFKNVDLREFTLNPEKEFIMDTNFLIGNHNDELTPWIPVIAARRKCDFFLLPCCPFGFYGPFTTKSKTSGSCSSIYNSYLEFLRNLCTKLGFTVREDRLRIPSTKRHCFLCSVPPAGLPADVESIIGSFTGCSNGSFLARTKSIQVLNNTKIPRELQELLVKKIFFYLYWKPNISATDWRQGGEVSLSEVIDILDEKDKLLLKSSCGGLQTFLKNHHQVFKVEKARVAVRDWATEGSAKNGKQKTKACWFHLNHPQGCPLSAELCSFKH